jgi:replicative DNA helicase
LETKKTIQNPLLRNPQNDGIHLPPQALDLEEAILGAMLLEKNAVNDAIDVLSPKSFYKEAHRTIYESIVALFQKAEPVDIFTITEHLRQRGELEKVGGAFYLSKLTQHIASGAHVEYYARIVGQKFIQRELIRVSSDIIKRAYDETTDVLELLDKAEQELFSVSESNLRKSYDSMGDILVRSLENIEEARKNKEGISGVATGFTQLDQLTSGFQSGQMIVVAARPAMGKTAFVLSMARNVAIDSQKPVAVFSLEMDAVELVNRLISSEAEIESGKIKKGLLSDDEFKMIYDRTGKLSKAPIFIDDTPALSVFELRAKCRRLKAKHDIQMVIIDYLQLMHAGSEKGGNREQEISAISRSIKSMAKELGIPFVALSQLSRAVETRGGDKRPQLSDLRESGAIEQDADMVMFLYRPEYYGLDQDEAGNSTKGLAQVIVAKHRGGGLETINLKFMSSFTKFVNFVSMEQATLDSKPMDKISSTRAKSRMHEVEEMPFAVPNGYDDLNDMPF